MNDHKEIFFKIIPYNTPSYYQAVILRENILRIPLGLAFSKEELVDEEHHIHVGGFINNELCATAALVPEKDVLKMQRVAIQRGFQRQGLGTALLLFCEDYAAKGGYHQIYCHARATAAVFYEKNGYKIEGEQFIETTIPHFLMRKRI